MKTVIIALIILSLAACAGSPVSNMGKSSEELETVGIYDICMAMSFTGTKSKSRPRFTEQIERRLPGNDMSWVGKRRVMVGMSRCELLMSMGGASRINRSSHGPDQWVFESRGLYSYSALYVYVRSNVVTAWN